MLTNEENSLHQDIKLSFDSKSTRNLKEMISNHRASAPADSSGYSLAVAPHGIAVVPKHDDKSRFKLEKD